MDIRERKVSNHYMLLGGVIGLVIAVLTGRLIQSPVLQLTALLLVILLSYVLYQIKAIGGADLKALIILSILSPGIELTLWADPILEAVVGGGLEILIMLIIGLAYSNWSKRVSSSQDKAERGTPLIPFLSVAYVIIQLLAFV
jgi:Flp pilus assembly protein protease CpaA